MGACALLVTQSTVVGEAPAPDANAAPEPEKKPAWEGLVAFGLTITSGNSDTLLANASARANKKWPKDELRLSLDATYGENDGDKSVEQVKASSQYNRTFGTEDRWYVYGRVEALHDAIADIDGRFTLGPGMGYYFVKNKKTSLSGEAGPGAVIEKVDDKDWETYYTLRIADRFEYKINDRAKIWQTAEFMPDVSDFENYIVNVEIGIESGVTKSWALRVVFQDTYDNEPSPGSKSNDLKLIAGMAYKF